MEAVTPGIPIIARFEDVVTIGNMNHERLVNVLCHKPWLLFALPFWLASGRKSFQAHIARHCQPEPWALPLHQGFLRWLRTEHEKGRPVHLVASASSSNHARHLAERMNLFSSVIALSAAGPEKEGALSILQEKCACSDFDYAGSNEDDWTFWSAGRSPIVVNAASDLVKRVVEKWPEAKVFPPLAATLGAWLRLLRVHQWPKNLLVLLPLVTSHQFGQQGNVLAAVICALAFCLTASAVYLINDLCDLNADRLHHRKRHRPLASGVIPLTHALAVIPLLLAATAALATLMRPSAAVVLAIYFLLTLAYSFWVKRMVLLDVICLSGLYVIRIVAGQEATQIPYSAWLLAFAMFLFFSLALVKRYSELRTAKLDGAEKINRRGYASGDLEIVTSLGTGSGLVSVLVVALYLNSSTVQTLYPSPFLLLPICPLVLYWISRMWLLAHRGQMHEDPVLFALRDRASWAVCFFIGVFIVIATLA